MTLTLTLTFTRVVFLCTGSGTAATDGAQATARRTLQRMSVASSAFDESVGSGLVDERLVRKYICRFVYLCIYRYRYRSI